VVSEEQEVGDEEEWTEEVGMIEEMILMDEGVVVDSEVDLMEEEVEGLMVDVGDLTVHEVVDTIVVVEVDQGSRSVLHSGKMNLENHLQVIGQIVLSVINICVKN
jgi:hypothetical protein